MIETCSPKRMVSLIAGLLFLTTVIFLLEEYVEESDADAYVMKGRTDWKSSTVGKERSKNEGSSPAPVQVQPQKGVQINRDLIDAECYLVEPVTLLEGCVPCSTFEKNAIKAAHCTQTGLYDKLNCTDTGKLGLRPCFPNAKSRFNLFFLAMVCLAGVTYASVYWRQGILDGHHYTRIQNFMN
ncbi:hypothetical protein L596_020232 [Steinernema carpocapsae]|uniref:Jumping translocation breakpoint protein n=1 Tax=Steinernema carpocapsae TaxID=34508 RepID=A0A4U5MT44_STECR|nr:hypothetical protein L596_020232 [Steinernema carpocapsae]